MAQTSEKTADEANAGYAIEDWLEFIPSILMAAAVILTAYSAYEATRWGGVQATGFATASTLRAKATNLITAGVTEVSYDAGTFGDLALAFRNDDFSDPSAVEAAINYADALTRDEFKPFLEEWLKLKGQARIDPINSPDPPGTPFDLPSYSNANLDEAELLVAEAEDFFGDAKDANQNGDDYILATIFFASVLFFTGIRMRNLLSRWAVILFAAIGLSLGIYQLLTLPFH